MATTIFDQLPDESEAERHIRRMVAALTIDGARLCLLKDDTSGRPPLRAELTFVRAVDEAGNVGAFVPVFAALRLVPSQPFDFAFSLRNTSVEDVVRRVVEAYADGTISYYYLEYSALIRLEAQIYDLRGEVGMMRRWVKAVATLVKQQSAIITIVERLTMPWWKRLFHRKSGA